MGIEVGFLAGFASAYSAWSAQKLMIAEASDEIDDDAEEVSRCLSCGSRHFREHNMVRICSYCRSEA